MKDSKLVICANAKGSVCKKETPVSSSPKFDFVVPDGKIVSLMTARGHVISFKSSDIRPMGKTSTGVRGIRLMANDFVVKLMVGDKALAPKITLRGGCGFTSKQVIKISETASKLEKQVNGKIVCYECGKELK